MKNGNQSVDEYEREQIHSPHKGILYIQIYEYAKHIKYQKKRHWTWEMTKEAA